MFVFPQRYCLNPSPIRCASTLLRSPLCVRSSCVCVFFLGGKQVATSAGNHLFVVQTPHFCDSYVWSALLFPSLQRMKKNARCLYPHFFYRGVVWCGAVEWCQTISTGAYVLNTRSKLLPVRTCVRRHLVVYFP